MRWQIFLQKTDDPGQKEARYYRIWMNDTIISKLAQLFV